jgi:hypothetical protein
MSWASYPVGITQGYAALFTNFLGGDQPAYTVISKDGVA